MQAECSVCLEAFNSAKTLPKVLACGHSLCAGCVSELADDEKLPCPECRELVPAVKLSTNFALLHVLLNKEEKEPPPSQEEQLRHTGWTEAEISRFWANVQALKAKAKAPKPVAEPPVILAVESLDRDATDSTVCSQPYWSCCGRDLLCECREVRDAPCMEFH
jgi:hypothetical protein